MVVCNKCWDISSNNLRARLTTDLLWCPRRAKKIVGTFHRTTWVCSYNRSTVLTIYTAGIQIQDGERKFWESQTNVWRASTCELDTKAVATSARRRRQRSHDRVEERTNKSHARRGNENEPGVFGDVADAVGRVASWPGQNSCRPLQIPRWWVQLSPESDAASRKVERGGSLLISERLVRQGRHDGYRKVGI